MTRKATCCCGACTIAVEGEPRLNALCHCANCKKRTGSAFGWSAYFADDQILGRTGDFRAYEIAGANPQHRWFCAACGSTLFWKSRLAAIGNGHRRRLLCRRAARSAVGHRLEPRPLRVARPARCVAHLRVGKG